MTDIDNVKSHLKMHQKYPATYDELVKECDDLKDFSNEDKKWFRETLPRKTFNSADDVIMALGI